MLSVMAIEQRLAEIGLALPEPMRSPADIAIPFAWVRVHRNNAYISGHGALYNGAPTGPFGKVPSGVSLEQAQHSARQATLAILAGLKAALGDLDRITAWLTVTGFVNADPGYHRTTLVLNPCSELLVELWGSDAGSHARTAIGVAALPFDLPVVIGGLVEVAV